MAAAETRGAHVIAIEAQEQLLLQTNQRLILAFLDLHKDDKNNQKLSEFVHNYYVNGLKTSEFKVSSDVFFHDLALVYKQNLLMLETLQSLDNNFSEKLDCIKASKRVSAVFFTAAAAITAATAAANANAKNAAVAGVTAAASIMLVALGKWIHSLLKKHEKAAERHKEIISVMIVGAKMATKDLSNIYVSARRLKFVSESMSETVDDGKKLAAMNNSFQELQGKDDEYSRNMNWVRETVLQSIIKHLD